tara:strand:- start:1157 stop:1822 length:666 start_codon:yes stop_codon:yes gene_type:complete
MLKIEEYKSLVFDCDGVILNSNKIKTDAFRKVTLPYGEDASEKLVDFHLNNGGISRYEKFIFFLNLISPNSSSSQKNDTLSLLLKNYAKECKKSLYNVEITNDLFFLKSKTSHTPWAIVSGGDQDELNDIFRFKKIHSMFESGIFGSPDPKSLIFKREINKKNFKLPALYFGDSKNDYYSAKENKMDFVFVKKWTDVIDYKIFCQDNSLFMIDSISEILNF